MSEDEISRVLNQKASLNEEGRLNHNPIGGAGLSLRHTLQRLNESPEINGSANEGKRSHDRHRRLIYHSLLVEDEQQNRNAIEFGQDNERLQFFHTQVITGSP